MVSMILGTPGVTAARDLAEERRMPVLAEFDLRSGGHVWVCSRNDPMTYEEKRGIAAVQERGVDAGALGFGGSAVIPSESNGAPLFVEVRVPKRKNGTIKPGSST